jgi:hypothetical protein
VVPDSIEFPPSRPSLALRVGVTGHRPPRVSSANEPTIREHVARALSSIKETCEAIGAEHDDVYDVDVTLDGPALTVLSSLAEGTDRLVAEVALNLGYRLYAPLPFARAEYKNDFAEPASRDAFDALLAQADVFELDGEAHRRARSYEAAGRLIVRNCDVLIAVWDGQDGDRGGTSEIVRFAAEYHIPIWWISTDPSVGPRLLIGPLFHLTAARPDANPAAALRQHVETMLRPPPAPREGMTLRILSRLLRQAQYDPKAHYFGLKDVRKSSGSWSALNDRFERVVRRSFKPAAAGLPMPPEPEHDAVTAWWLKHFAPADVAAVEYSCRIRSAYLWAAFLAIIAISAAVATTVVPFTVRPYSLIIELLALVITICLLILSQFDRWHEHWIELRLLAELCREQSFLAPIGRAVERSRIEPHSTESNSWIVWHFAALQRSAPLPTGTIASILPFAKAYGLFHAVDQANYHLRREGRVTLINRRLKLGGDVFFLLAIMILATDVIRLAVFHNIAEQTAAAYEATCAITLALGASAATIRAYFEYELLERQSRRMYRTLEDFQTNLEAIDVEGIPLASLDLGQELQAQSTAMLQDHDGWAQLFGIKVLEHG